MPSYHRVSRLVYAGLIAAGLAACSGEDVTEEGPGLGQAYPPSPPGDSAVLTTTEPEQLNDPQIAAVLASADTAQIAPSLLAMDAAENTEVIEVAAVLVRDYGRLSDSIRVITQRAEIMPVENRVSELVETQTRAILESLQNQTGAAFDSAYVAAMVMSHEFTLNLIDSQLLPGADNELLRNFIDQHMRPQVAAHLRQIQQIQMTIDAP